MVGCSLVVGVGRAVGSGVATGPERGMRVQWHGSGTAGAGARGGNHREALLVELADLRDVERRRRDVQQPRDLAHLPLLQHLRACVRAWRSRVVRRKEASDEPSVANGRVVWCGGVEIAGGSGRSAARTRAISRAQSRARARTQRRRLRVGSWRGGSRGRDETHLRDLGGAHVAAPPRRVGVAAARARLGAAVLGPLGPVRQLRQTREEERCGRQVGVCVRLRVRGCVFACVRVCVCACVCETKSGCVCGGGVGWGGEPPAARRTTARGP